MGFVGPVGPPEQPPTQATHEEPTYASPLEHWSHPGQFAAPFEQDGGPTATVTDWSGEVPPGPVHWKVNVVAAASGSVRPLPESVP